MAKSSGLAATVRRRIRELRGSQGMTQLDLEMRLDGEYSQAMLSHFEVGRKQPSLSAVERLAKAFGVHPAALLLDPEGAQQDAAAAEILAGSASLARRAIAALKKR